MRELKVTSYKLKHIIHYYVSLRDKSRPLQDFYPFLLTISRLNDLYRTSLRNLINVGGLCHV